MKAHEQLLAKTKAGKIDIYFEGDSIVRRWGATDYPQFLDNWRQNFFGWNAADFGWGADTTQNILWRLNHGELDGVNPKVIVLLAGTNNIGNRVSPEGNDAKVADVTRGLKKIVETMRDKAPDATIILTGIFPRNDNMAVVPTINKINQNLDGSADGKKVRFLNINDKLADANGKLLDGMMNADKLHPAVGGYQMWADALKPIFTELLGPPQKEDHAPPPTGDPSAKPRAAAPGKPVVFNDNGAWCWYQDPRVVHDPANDTLLIASVACSDGVGGVERGGDVDIVTYELGGGTSSRFVLHHALQPEDDHNTAAILIRPDGKYLAMYSRHNQDSTTFWRISSKPHDASAWEPEQTFDWTPYFNAVNPANHVTYSNLFYLPAENRTYDFSRAVNTDPTILISPDHGDSWSFGGKLLTGSRVGYVNGYTKYTSNGTDRVDFITTEHHPRDFNNSIYHGYIRGGKLHQSDGSVIDENILDNDAPATTKLTKVFAAGSVVGADTMTHAWTVCLHLDPTGQPFGLISARANDTPENSNFNDHRLFYIRFDGSQWNVHQVAKLGACLWPAEQDYTGLGDVDPTDPNTVYVSTPIDPRDGKTLKAHEIFKGATIDAGKTWTWTAITSDSTVDNLRPIVLTWGQGGRSAMWFRGTMSRSQHYNCEIVGMIEGK